MPNEHRLEEQFLSQEAEKQVSNQLDEVEEIAIDVKTDLLKILQGQADGVAVAGQGLVIKEDIRIQEIKLQTDSIAINPFSALFGQIELNEPINTIARVILTEVDINRALTSEFVRSQMQNFELNVDGEIVSFEPEEIQVFLPGDGKMEFRGKVQLKEMGNTRPLAYTAIARPRTHSQPAMLEAFNCTEGEGISIELITALMQKAKELMNIPSFKWEEIAFSIKNLEVQKGTLILMLEVQVKQIPPSSSLISP
ncbi:LmeA family phospholipid-binding protein [Nostoc sp.]|uniref:LmeA family phospholipid-binding protein n=1 Tax=Nostoc sp. TaxID=1180 RepID=UPI002FF44245